MAKLSLSRVFAIGFGLGVAISVAMLLSHSLLVWWTPLWQQILLFPGILLGNAFYNCCHEWFPDSWDIIPEIVLGTISVGLWYGTLCSAVIVVIRKVQPATRRSASP